VTSEHIKCSVSQTSVSLFKIFKFRTIFTLIRWWLSVEPQSYVLFLDIDLYLFLDIDQGINLLRNFSHYETTIPAEWPGQSNLSMRRVKSSALNPSSCRRCQTGWPLSPRSLTLQQTLLEATLFSQGESPIPYPS
jgi:hypothetical protein